MNYGSPRFGGFRVQRSLLEELYATALLRQGSTVFELSVMLWFSLLIWLIVDIAAGRTSASAPQLLTGAALPGIIFAFGFVAVSWLLLRGLDLLLLVSGPAAITLRKVCMVIIVGLTIAAGMTRRLRKRRGSEPELTVLFR